MIARNTLDEAKLILKVAFIMAALVLVLYYGKSCGSPQKPKTVKMNFPAMAMKNE